MVVVVVVVVVVDVVVVCGGAPIDGTAEPTMADAKGVCTVGAGAALIITTAGVPGGSDGIASIAA